LQKTTETMKDKYRYGTSQLFNFAQDSYFERTSRPIYAIGFLLPFIVFYEMGTIFININVLKHYWQGRVVAFSWLQRFLEYLGFGSRLAWVATPLAVVVILLALQLASRKRWHFSMGDVGPMLVECVLLALPLIVFGLLLNGPAEPQADFDKSTMLFGGIPVCSSAANEGQSSAVDDNGGGPAIKLLADIVTGIGAGIYEELVFRLILICLLMLLFQDVLRFSHKNSIILSVLISAALFSAYHHIDFLSGQLYQRVPFNWPEFGFRTIAGVYFAVLFAIRGFGITAGTHAFYDILATIINAAFFSNVD
ncbi:MAG: CPBP family intramembrane glutamic endopeptidase, partial [Planctomycetota bacterium]